MSRKGSVALVLVLTLSTAGTASALPFSPEMAEAADEGGLLAGWWNRFLSWIDRMAGGEGEDLTIQRTEGCHIDPNGLCVSGG